MSHIEDELTKLAAKFGPQMEKASDDERPKLSEEYRREKSKILFRQHVETAGGGIFTRKTRRRLSGILGLSGRDNTKKDFWLDVRNRVKTALVDLWLFIEMAPDNQANQVLTHDSLKPIVDDLLWDTMNFLPNPERNELYLERAKIARLFIKAGFDYLSSMNPTMMTLSHKRTIEDALDLSRFLLASFNQP